MQLLIAIPARLASTRLPAKPLQDIHGRTLIQHVALAMLKVPDAEVVVVADDERIVASAAEVGARTFHSRRPAASGSDRIRHFLDDSGRDWPDLIVNVQGDEPLLEPEAVEALARRLADPGVRAVTLLRPLRGRDEVADPNVVKALGLRTGLVEDFRRLPLLDRAPIASPGDFRCARRRAWMAHVGVYGFREEAFRAFTDLAPSPRELAERLEQLRMLNGGIPIHGVEYDTRARGVDTPEDLAAVRSILARERGGSSTALPG